MNNDQTARLNNALKKRSEPIVARYQDASAYIATAREKAQESAEVLLRAARALKGEVGEQELTALANRILEIAEGIGSDPEKTIHACHRYVGEAYAERMNAIRNEVIDEFQSSRESNS